MRHTNWDAERDALATTRHRPHPTRTPHLHKSAILCERTRLTTLLAVILPGLAQKLRHSRGEAHPKGKAPLRALDAIVPTHFKTKTTQRKTAQPQLRGPPWKK